MSPVSRPPAPLRHDPDLVRQACALLLEPGAVTELRVIKKGGGAESGYFDDRDALVRAAESWSDRAEGVYVLLNPAKPELLARAANHMVPRPKHATGDLDVVARRWLMADIDARRPAGISSTDAEHEAALAKAQEIAAYIEGLGAPPLAIADSGNGAHVQIPVDLPNDPAMTTLCSRVLLGLNLLFSDAVVHVDLKTFNAARISRLYGTVACKGDSTVDRPHRRSRLVRVPESRGVCPASVLEQLAALAPPAPATRSAWDGGRPAFDLDAFLERHQDTLHVVRSGEWNGGWKWILNPCPWNSEHTNKAAYIVRHASGAISAGCHHNGCAGRDWADLREMQESRRVSVALVPSPGTPESTHAVDSGDATPPAPLEVPDEAMVGLGREFADLYSQYLESPKAFFFFSYLTFFGSCISGKVTLDAELAPPPRLFTVLLGESGTAKKSYAIEKTYEFFRSLPESSVPAVLRGAGSAEGIAEELKSNPTQVLWFDEFKAFVGKASNETSIMMPMVSTLFGSDVYENRIRERKIAVRGVGLSLITACTIDTYESLFGREFHALGFINRLWLVSGQRQARFSLPQAIPLAEKSALRDRTAEALTRIDVAWHRNGQRPVPYPITPAARAMFHGWYLGLAGSPFERRLDAYAHRLMVLLAATTGSTVIDEGVVARVISLANYQLEVRRAYDPVDADNATAAMEEKIRRTLARGPLRTWPLKRACHYDRAGVYVFVQALSNLVKTKEVLTDNNRLTDAETFRLNPEHTPTPPPSRPRGHEEVF